MKNYKTVLISAVVYSMVIGLIYVALSVFALLARNCIVGMEGSSVVYMMFLLYFRVDNCSPSINWSLLGVTSTSNANLPDESQAVNRTFIFSYVYLGLYAGLIVTALYSLLGIKNSCIGRKSFPVFFVPYIIVACAVLIMDVLATIYYISDTVTTTSVDGLMDLLEIGNREIVRADFESLAAYLRFLPPLLMFLATSKCFFLLIMDVVIITLISRAGWTAATYHKYVDDTVRQYSRNIASQSNPAFEDSQTDIVAQKQANRQMEYMSNQGVQDGPVRSPTHAASEQSTPSRYNDTSRDTIAHAFVYPDRVNNLRNDQRQQQEQEEKMHSIPRPTSLALQSRHSERPLSYQNSKAQPYDAPLDDEIENRLSHYTTSNGKEIRSVEPLKDENNFPDRQQQQTRVRVLPVIDRNSSSSEIKLKPIVPPKPYNPNRVSKQPSYVEERRQERPDSRTSGGKIDRTSSMNAPEELRGQLPWSYFKPRDDVPKKAFTELKEDEELPAVPIPDYTLHFPKNKRANLNDSDGDGSWSRHDQRY